MQLWQTKTDKKKHNKTQNQETVQCVLDTYMLWTYNCIVYIIIYYITHIIYTYYIYAHIHTHTHMHTHNYKFQLKQKWRLTMAIAEMKRDTEQTMKLSSCTKLALRASWSHGLIAQTVRAPERNSVVVCSNLIQGNSL